MSIDYEELRKPFDPADIKWRVQKAIKNGKSAMVLAYADTRVYEERLDDVVGPENWQSLAEITTNDVGIIATVTVTIDGVSKTQTGEEKLAYDSGELKNNIATSAFAQGFKRACSAFSLGRYIYELEGPFFVDLNYDNPYDYDFQTSYNGKKAGYNAPELPAWAKPSGSGKKQKKQKTKSQPKPKPKAKSKPSSADSFPEKEAQPDATPEADFDPNEKIGFGKFKKKGKTWAEVPRGYLKWMEEEFEDADKDWKLEAHEKTVKELARRKELINSLIKQAGNEAKAKDIPVDLLPQVSEAMFSAKDRFQLTVDEAEQVLELVKESTEEDLQQIIDGGK